MEAMTQEFMLHSHTQVEIWSAREGSDDDNHSIQSQPWTIQGSTSETKSLMDPNQPTNKPKTGSTSEAKSLIDPQTQNQKGPFQKPKSDGSQTNPNVHNWSTSKSDRPNTWHTTTQVFFPGSDFSSYKTIGCKAKSSLQGFSVDKSHVAELANHN